MPTFQIEASTIVTQYTAKTVEQALDMYAQDAGYKSYAEVVAQFGEVDSTTEI